MRADSRRRVFSPVTLRQMRTRRIGVRTSCRGFLSGPSARTPRSSSRIPKRTVGWTDLGGVRPMPCPYVEGGGGGCSNLWARVRARTRLGSFARKKVQVFRRKNPTSVRRKLQDDHRRADITVALMSDFCCREPTAARWGTASDTRGNGVDRQTRHGTSRAQPGDVIRERFVTR